MKKKLIYIVLLVVAVAAVALGVRLYGGRFSNNSPDLKVSGNIEITEVQASFKVAGRVQERPVEEGQKVSAGQILARLDDTDLAQDVAIQQAQVDSAKAMLAELEAGSRPQEIAVAEAAVRRAEAELAQQQRDLERRKQLYEKNVISPQDYELAELSYNVASTRLQEAREQSKLVQEGPRKEKIQQARAGLQQAEQSLRLAETHLAYATLKAPMSGVVLSKHVEPGEYVVPGTPIVTLGALENVWLRAYINEVDLGRVKLGQPVRVTTDSYPGKAYEGHISFISSEAEFTPKSVQTPEERVKLVYRIKVDIPNPAMELKAGMPADAEILLNEAAN